MMRGWRQAGLGIMAALAIMAGVVERTVWAQAAPAAEPKLVVRRIDVEGNQRLTRSAILGALRLKEGDVYQPQAVDQGVTNLWALGAFEDVKVQRQPFEDGVRLLFTVKERSTVAKIAFTGNKALAESKLAEILEFKGKDYLNSYLIQSGRDRIAEKYRDEGYQFAEVKVAVQEAPKGATVTYTINEGPRVKVRAILFTGNKAYNAAKLRSQMQTAIYRWILSPGVYKEEQLRADLSAIKEFYRSNGWLDVVVARELSYSDDKKFLTITIHVQEGERYKVESVVISGNDIFTGAEIRKKLILKEGSPFVTDDMRKDQGTISDMYGEQGFIDVQVKPRTSLSERGALVVVKYDIEERRRVFVERIQIRGNEKTQDHVIRREITLTPGERFDTRKVRESQARLRNTGLFQAYDDKNQIIPIKFDTEPGTAPDRRDLVADVTEGKTGELSLGVGVSSNAGVVGEFSLTQENFNAFDFPKSWQDFVSGNSFVGGGQVLTLRARPGTSRQDYLVSFREPSAFDTQYGFGMSAFYSERSREDWDESRLGGTVSLDRGFWKYWRAGVSYVPEMVRVYNLAYAVTDPAGPVTDILAVKGTSADMSVKFDLVRDSRDNRFLPTSGSRFESYAQVASTGMGGDYDFVKGEIEAKQYITLFNVPNWGKHVLSVGVDAGLAAPFDGTNRVPIFDRFFAGGPGDSASMRGFRFRGIGPVQGAENVQVGGEGMVLTTAEYEFPIIQDTIRGVVFSDAGTLAREVDNLGDQEFRVAVGTGLRLRFPFFGGIPIALDWGIPVSKVKTDRTQVFSFTIGTGFRF